MTDALQAALGRLRLSIAGASVLVALFLLLPVVIIVATSFTNGIFLTFPPEGFSLKWYGTIIHSEEWRNPFFASLRVGLFATAIATVVGTTAALGMRRIVRGRRWLSAALVAPIALPVLAYALGLWDMFQRVTWFEGTSIPVALGQAVTAFPLVYVIVAAGLAAVDRRITDAAATLGARWPTIVWRIELPLIRTSIVIAVLFAFTTVFDEVVIALFVAPPETPTLPVQMFRAARESIAPELSAASSLVTLLAVIIMLVGGTIGRTVERRRVA